MKSLTKDQQRSKELFSQMRPVDKVRHIWLYFKWYILLGIAAAAVAVSAIHGAVTAKDPVLYVGYLNVSVGEDLDARLSGGFLNAQELDSKKNEVLFYRDLYLSVDPSAENHQYAYATRMKVLATINSKQLDVVLMNREAYDLMSGSGYLLDLSPLFGDNAATAPLLTANTVILEDNAMEYDLHQAEEYISVTEDVVNGLNLTDAPMFRQAGFSGDVYAGIIANTPRTETSVDYLVYLVSAEAAHHDIEGN